MSLKHPSRDYSMPVEVWNVAVDNMINEHIMKTCSIPLIYSCLDEAGSSLTAQEQMSVFDMLLKGSNTEECEGEWLHPFEDNLFEIKKEIIGEIDPQGDAHFCEHEHLDFCRQLAGGC